MRRMSEEAVGQNQGGVIWKYWDSWLEGLSTGQRFMIWHLRWADSSNIFERSRVKNT